MYGEELHSDNSESALVGYILLLSLEIKNDGKFSHYTHLFCTVDFQKTIHSTWFAKYLNFSIHLQKAWENKMFFNWIFCFNQTFCVFCVLWFFRHQLGIYIYLQNRTVAILSIDSEKKSDEIECENESERRIRHGLIDCKDLYTKTKLSAKRTWGGKYILSIAFNFSPFYRRISS